MEKSQALNTVLEETEDKTDRHTIHGDGSTCDPETAQGRRKILDYSETKDLQNENVFKKLD